MSRIVFTVTNELVFDQRMIRICDSLQNSGYDVTLVGRRFQNAAPITPQTYRQKRLFCFFKKGKLFYVEYNIRLFFYLLIKSTDAITAIDLDTIVPCLLVSKIKKCPRFYDAHELFTEMKEVVSRPGVYRFWKKLEKWTLPHFKHGYTVNQPLADEFKKRYGVHYDVIQNAAVYKPFKVSDGKRKDVIIYQGAVNEGRCFENLIPAMKEIPYTLIICGDGNYMTQLKALIDIHGVSNKVVLMGKIEPSILKVITSEAKIGITLFERDSANNFLSLANRFFDYIHAGTPQICVNFPAYKKINDSFHIAKLIPDTEPKTLSSVINELMANQFQWEELHRNCVTSAPLLSWQHEEIKLIAFYKKHLG